MLLQTLNVLKKSGVVLLPTDTIWGLIADAQNEAAVERIYQIKGRNNTKPLQILVSSEGDIARYGETDDFVSKCITALSGKSITYVLRAKSGFSLNPKLVSKGKVGIRVTKDPFLIEVINKLGHAVAATSANFADAHTPSAGGVEVVDVGIRSAVDLVINKGSCGLGVHSTVLDLSSGVACVLRNGCVTEEEIQRLLL